MAYLPANAQSGSSSHNDYANSSKLYYLDLTWLHPILDMTTIALVFQYFWWDGSTKLVSVFGSFTIFCLLLKISFLLSALLYHELILLGVFYFYIAAWLLYCIHNLLLNYCLPALFRITQFCHTCKWIM
jgi:hypothetical protein